MQFCAWVPIAQASRAYSCVPTVLMGAAASTKRHPAASPRCGGGQRVTFLETAEHVYLPGLSPHRCFIWINSFCNRSKITVRIVSVCTSYTSAVFCKITNV